MIPAFTPACQFCLQPMQLLGEVFDINGKVISRTFICSCQGPVRYENYHAGDVHQDKKSATA